MNTDLRRWMTLCEAEEDDLTRLARVLADKLYDWITGGPMYSGENQSYVEDFKFLARYIPPNRKRKLRLLYRGVRVDNIPEDWANGTARMAVTSLKPLQSWSTKVTTAREFTSEYRHWTKGEYGVLFTARASALPVLFTMEDLRECFWRLVEQIPWEIRHQFGGIGQYSGVDYDLDRYANQNEVIVLAEPGTELPVVNITLRPEIGW